jgi:hypothetical protein
VPQKRRSKAPRRSGRFAEADQAARQPLATDCCPLFSMRGRQQSSESRHKVVQVGLTRTVTLPSATLTAVTRATGHDARTYRAFPKASVLIESLRAMRSFRRPLTSRRVVVTVSTPNSE